MKICHCDWSNKEDDRPIVKQDKVRQESQIENDGMRKGNVRGVTNQKESKSDIQDGTEVKVTSLRVAHRLIEMEYVVRPS